MCENQSESEVTRKRKEVVNLKNRIYLDNAATTRVDEDITKAMLPYMTEQYGNASAIYSLGKQAREAVEQARIQVARAIGAQRPDEIYFVSCGSEADNMAIKGIAYANQARGNHIITTKIEHQAVLDTCHFLETQGFTVTYVPVDREGRIYLQELENAITDRTILITVMAANNEIGTIQPIREIADIAKKHGIYFHTDAVQAIGNIPVNVQEWGVDALSLSAHKFHGPKGIGALYVRKGVPFTKYMHGGHQEQNQRAGTENVAGIVGLGKAITKACYNLEEHDRHVRNLRDYYIYLVQKTMPWTFVNGEKIHRLPGNANICFRGIDGKYLLTELDKRGICASVGSACAAGNVNPSHVLLALGLSPQDAKCSMRTTFDKDNTKEEVEYTVKVLQEITRNMREKERI